MALNAPTSWHNGPEHRRRLADAVNGAIDGRTNNAGLLTITASQTTTAITDSRVGIDSVILLSPLTANAAAAIGTTYVSARGDSTFTLTHANNAQTDRDFAYAVVATGYTLNRA